MRRTVRARFPPVGDADWIREICVCFQSRPASFKSAMAGALGAGFLSAKTASSDVRKRVYPRPLEKNLTCGSVCPLLISKLNGSLPYASIVRAVAARSSLVGLGRADFPSAWAGEAVVGFT